MSGRRETGSLQIPTEHLDGELKEIAEKINAELRVLVGAVNVAAAAALGKKTQDSIDKINREWKVIERDLSKVRALREEIVEFTKKVMKSTEEKDDPRKKS